MKKLLITGVEPFGGESINPSWEAVMRLPDEINGYKISKLLIPVDACLEGAKSRLGKERYDVPWIDVVLIRAWRGK